MVQMLESTLTGSAPVIENRFRFRAQQLKIIPSLLQKVLIDGEVGELSSLEIECLPDALTVLVPPIQQ